MVDKNGVVKGQTLPTAEVKKPSFSAIIRQENYKKRFEEVLKENAPQFISGLISAVNLNSKLKDADPDSVCGSAMVAASLDLSVIPSLGFAALVPYGKQCQFQIMYKGLIQLALRSGQYKSINVTEIYKDEFSGFNPLTGQVSIDTSILNGDRANERKANVIGYAAYFSFVNGYEHTEFWSNKRVLDHAKKYTKSYNQQYGTFSGAWLTHFDEMAKKTVLKNALSKWGILSTKMQKAIVDDQKIYSDADDEGVYEEVQESATEAPVEAPKKEEAKAKVEAPKAQPKPVEQHKPVEVAPVQEIEDEGAMMAFNSVTDEGTYGF